jgi:antitoxin component YwqK of YwqJK toxin-antitoxin module
VIQGYSCAKGYTWFYADGKLNECFVSQETQYGEALIPRGSVIYLKPDGRPDFAMLEHDSEVAGVRCSGGNWLLGPSEGAMTVFYPSGKLEQCWLAGDQSVQGVPCMTAGFIGLFGDGARRDGGAKFYESGKLESCTLAKDFGGKRRGEHFQQGQ